MSLFVSDGAIFGKRHDVHNSVRDALNLVGSAQLILK
jgi:hypothetical protein